MFRIADGREQFYQWDLDRQVIVEDPSIVEVHFCNRTDECSLVTEVIDGLANVPNIILQKSFDVRVFGYDGKATRYDKVFKVKPRTQPSDYIYTETVIKSIDEIMTAAEQVHTITNEFYEFVDDYKLGLVDDGQGNVELKAVEKEAGEVDLDNYYTKDEIDILLDDIETGDVDLTGYATEEWVKNQGYLTEHQSLEGYAKKTDIPDISGKADKVHSHPEYLTEHQSLAGYATESFVKTAIANSFAGIATAEGGSY
jgi:hypothetical protein